MDTFGRISSRKIEWSEINGIQRPAIHTMKGNAELLAEQQRLYIVFNRLLCPGRQTDIAQYRNKDSLFIVELFFKTFCIGILWIEFQRIRIGLACTFSVSLLLGFSQQVPGIGG